MQITEGTVSVTFDNNLVVSTLSALTDSWVNIAIGNIFIVAGDVVPYYVTSKIAPNVSTSGFWELTLSSVYVGETATEKGYTIVGDFTARMNIPLLNRGDAESALIYNRAMALIDAATAQALLDLTDFPISTAPQRVLNAGKFLRIKNDGSGFELVTISGATISGFPEGSPGEIGTLFSRIYETSYPPRTDILANTRYTVTWDFSDITNFENPNFIPSIKIFQLGFEAVAECFELVSRRTTSSVTWVFRMVDSFVAEGGYLGALEFDVSVLGIATVPIPPTPSTGPITVLEYTDWGDELTI